MIARSIRVAVVGALAMVGPWSARAAEETIKLGLIEPFSGPIAAIGKDTLEGFEYSVGVVNARGGVLGGRKLEVVPLDNAMNAEKTTEQLRKAIDMGLRFISQGVGSNHALNIIQQLDKHNARNPKQSILYLNHSAVTTDFTNELCSFWHFRFDANVDMKVAALASWMGSDDAVKKIYLLNQNYAYGKSFQEAANKLVKERVPSAEIVGDELIVPFGKVQDFTPYIAKIKAAGADTVLTGNWGPDLVRLIKAGADAGLKVQYYTIYGGIPSTLNALGADAATFAPLKQVTEFHSNDAVNSKPIMTYAKGYEDQYKKSYYADRFRYLIEMWAAALNRAGTDDPVAVALELENMTFLGAGGETYMRGADHQIIMPMVVSTVSKDVKKPLIYGDQNFGMAFKTDGWVTRKFLDLPTTCKMKRPA